MPIVPVIDGPHNGKNHDACNGHALYKAGNLNFQWGFLFINAFQAFSNFTQPRFVANSGDGGNGQTACHGCAAVYGFVGVILVFKNRIRFSGQYRFVYRKIVGMCNTAIGGNQRAFFHHQAVANHQIFAFDVLGFSVADHLAVGLRKIFQFFQSVFAPRILIQRNGSLKYDGNREK